MSRYSSAKTIVKKNKVVIKQTKGPGRKAEFEWDCRFCGEQLATEGFINAHYIKTHKKEGKLKHLPRSPKKLHCPYHKVSAIVNQSLKPFGKILVCPSPDCNGRLVD